MATQGRPTAADSDAPRLVPRPLTPNEQAVLAEYRRWSAMQRPGRELTVHLRVSIGPTGDVDVYGGAGEGKGW